MKFSLMAYLLWFSLKLIVVSKLNGEKRILILLLFGWQSNESMCGLLTSIQLMVKMTFCNNFGMIVIVFSPSPWKHAL